MRTTIFASFLLIQLTVLTAAAQFTPGGVRVQAVSATGTGCQAGSYSAVVTPDGQSFSLLLDNYIAESTRQMTLDRKGCEIAVTLAVPSGWSFAVISAEYRGFANVQGGAIATHQALYSFNGARPPNERPGSDNGNGRYALKAQDFVGPFQDNYYIRNDLDIRTAAWSPCNASNVQTLQISTYLMARSLNNRSPADAMITLDTLDGAIQTQNYRLAWRVCTPNRPDRPDVRPPEPPRPPQPPTPPRPPQPRPPRFPG